MGRLSRIAVVFAVVGGLGLGLGGGLRAQAQSLFLTSSKASAKVGDTIVFTLNLNAGSGKTLSTMDAAVFIDSTYLFFVGATPYTSVSAFNKPDIDDNIQRFSTDGLSPTVTYPSGENRDLDINYVTTAFSGAPFSGVSALGTFTVQVSQALPSAGTFVTLGPPNTTGTGLAAFQGGSELYDGAGQPAIQSIGAAVKLTPSPEPSSALTLIAGAALLAFQVKRRAVARP